MKKLIPIVLVLLLISGCSANKYTPVINADYELSAVYKTGDFSYSCIIEKKGETVSITPISTRAKGMIISCNGKEISFKRKNFIKSFRIEEIDKTNPALILYRVLTSLDSAQTNLIDGEFTYTGKCELGKYILTQKKDNSFSSLSIPQADIKIEFM